MTNRTLSTEAVAVVVKRAGWLVYAADPDNFWSAELDGMVGDARDATWYPTRDAAQALIDRRGLGRVYAPKHMAELEEA